MNAIAGIMLGPLLPLFHSAHLPLGLLLLFPHQHSFCFFIAHFANPISISVSIDLYLVIYLYIHLSICILFYISSILCTILLMPLQPTHSFYSSIYLSISLSMCLFSFPYINPLLFIIVYLFTVFTIT